jgi:uncharacterized protein involved in type VI secretion and phage assembly
LGSEIGIARSDVVDALGGGSINVADRPVANAQEAQALAESLSARLGNAYVEAEGTCRGDPRLRAGAVVNVDGVGTRFGGRYTLSSTTHVYRGGTGYQTHFTVSGGPTRSLSALMTQPRRNEWARSLLIGVVTQNQDPDGLGRVRVTYPQLDRTESWWARIASISAGTDRGALMLPQVGDEVLVGFEQGDARRPYVLGSLWNGQAKPGQVVHNDGSFALQSDQRVLVAAKGDVSLRSEKDLRIETDGKVSAKASGDTVVEGQRVTVKAGAALTLESSADITIKGSSLTLQATGVVRLTGAQVTLG